MQTFLPYPNFYGSAACLDRQRLGKQRVEAMQLLKGQWPNHPASKMWRGYEEALALYHNIVIITWVNRGYNNNMWLYPVGKVVFPPWFGDEDFHASHRSNLLRKKPEWYGRMGWAEHDNLEYIWPI